jgi:hypothetical protein
MQTRMNAPSAKKTEPAAKAPYRCIPVSATEAAANFRLCVVLRDPLDPVAGHFLLLRNAPGARAILGALCDAENHVREWLELWIQDVESMPGGETLVPSNAARDKAWEQLVARLRETDPGGSFSTIHEKEPPGPVFIDISHWRPWHPASDAGEIAVCRDAVALTGAGLPVYAESAARFGRARAGGAFVALNEAAGGAKGAVALETLLPAGGDRIALNPGGGMLFARRFAPLGMEEFAEVLGGEPWSGLLNAKRPFRLDGIYPQLCDETEMQAAGRHFYGGRGERGGRLAEVLCLKLLLIHQCIRAVADEVRRTGLPLLNVTPESFRVSLGAVSSNLPFCWASRVVLVQLGDAVALDIPSSTTRYFATRSRPTASIYRPEELGLPRQGRGGVRIRRVFAPAEGGIAAEGTLSSHERLNLQPTELLRLRLPLPEGGEIELIGYTDAGTALTSGEASFRTVPLQLDDRYAAALRSYEGIPFSHVPFEVLQPLNTPCDLYALGVLGLRVLYAGSAISLPVILDTALSLLRAASSEPGESPIESRLLNLLRTDERWLEALGSQHLVRPCAETGAPAPVTLPPEIWSRILAAILPFFPGRSPESFCRDFADAPTLAPQVPFQAALRSIERALDTSRALFLSTWRDNEEIASILIRHLPAP